MSVVLPIAYFDPPQVLNAKVTNIPASSQPTLQIILDTGINYGIGIAYSDTTGDFIGVYIGNVGVETLACIVGNGVTSVAWGNFPPHSRVSLRSMVNTSIKAGTLTGAIVTG